MYRNIIKNENQINSLIRNMIQNKTDGCPEGTQGFAFWTCNPSSGEFRPKQVLLRDAVKKKNRIFYDIVSKGG